MPEMIEIARLHDHPNNPRLDKAKRKEFVERVARLMKERVATGQAGFDEAHALIVRPHSGAYQIVSGHRRKQAAKRAGLTEVPCWVREMTDEEAHMLLLNENIQDGLHPIEEGAHQLTSGLSQRDYAARIGVSRSTLKPKVEAAEVYETIQKTVSLGEVDKRWRALAALHAASPWLWPLWAPRLVKEGWKIEDTVLHVGRAGRAQQPPRWADAEGIADGLLKGVVRAEEVHEMDRLIWGIKDRQERETILQALAAARPSSLAAAKRVIEAQTPVPLPDDDEAAEDPWPAESSLDEPTLEEEYHGVHAAHSEQRAQKRFRQLLKMPYQPRPTFHDATPAEREHLREQIRHLKEWLGAVEAELDAE